MSTSTDLKTRQIARTSDDWLERRRALIELSHAKDPDLYDLFLRALADPNKGIQHAAILALARLGNPEAVAGLAKPKFLKAEDLQVRLATVKALGKLGDAKVIDHLFDSMDDPEWLVRNEALSVLRDKVETIVHNGNPAQARILVRMLGISDPGIAEIAMQGLIEMEPVIRPLLIDNLKNVRPAVRLYVARVIGASRTTEALQYLIENLQDADLQVRIETARALGQIGDTRAIPQLIASLHNRNKVHLQTTIDALVRFGTTAVMPLHSALKNNRDSLVKCALIDTLGHIGDPSSIAILIRHLSDSCFVIRNAAIRALQHFGPAAAQAVLPLLQFEPIDIDELCKAAQSQSSVNNRLRAMKALGDLEDHRAAPLLKQLSNDQNPEVAQTAQEALIRIGCAAWGRCGALMVIGQTENRKWSDKILSSLADDSPHVRYEAVRAIGRLNGTQTAIKLKETAVKDPVHQVRSEALKVLRGMALGSAEMLQTALQATKDSDPAVRLEATRILGDLVHEQGLPALKERLLDPIWSIRVSAENGLVNYGKTVVPQLIELLTSDKSETRYCAISALGRLGDTVAIEPLETIAQNPKTPPREMEIARQSLLLLKRETGRKR
ncbi:MAG TPA: HEAT repeat domain-containing protein [bacterium]|nr:HEAT repeat domain-containing protein [bacterium]